jgi:hypothetical protein
MREALKILDRSVTILLDKNTYTYVLNGNGDIVFAKRFNPNSSKSRAPHPTLIGGKDPQVQCAGMIRIEKGRIVWYNNDSGHFRPNAKSLEKVDNAMEELKRIHPEIFAKTIKEEIADERTT